LRRRRRRASARLKSDCTRAYARGDEVLAGDDRDHAGSARGGDVDRRDARMQVRRAQELQHRLTRKRDVVREQTAPGQQRVVLDPLDRLAAAEARCSENDSLVRASRSRSISSMSSSTSAMARASISKCARGAPPCARGSAADATPFARPRAFRRQRPFFDPRAHVLLARVARMAQLDERQAVFDLDDLQGHGGVLLIRHAARSAKMPSTTRGTLPARRR
jgi:hypothetical protein